MIDDINRWSKGWGGYFRHGYPRKCSTLNGYVLQLRADHLRRRSQRRLPYPGQASRFTPICEDLGLRLL